MDVAALDEYLSERANKDQFSGAAQISREGMTVFTGAYGRASRTWGVPSSTDIRFDTASITKLFTAVLCLQVVETGALSLDTRAHEILDLSGTEIHPDVTLHHLLTHTSGIGDDAEEEDGEDYADIWKTRISYSVRETTDLFDQFIHQPPNFPPGEGCRYCNAGFIVAGAMVETVTGTTFRHLVATRIFDVAGMEASGFFSMDIIEPRVAEGADLVAGVWIRSIYSYPPVGSPDGGAHCTVGDLHRFFAAARDGQLLGPEMTDLFFEPQAHHSDTGDGSYHMGYGIEFHLDGNGEVVFVEKEGINAGTSGFLRHYPGSDTTVAMLSNMADGVWEPRDVIHRMIIDV